MSPDNDPLDSALNAVSAPLLICAENRIVFANRTAELLTGYSQQELCSRTPQSLLVSYVYLGSHSDADTPAECELQTAGGHSLIIQFQCSPVAYKGLQAEIITLTDVTQAQLMEKRYQAIGENTIDVMVVTNGNGIVLSVSPAVKDILGYSESDLLKTNSLDLVYGDDKAIVAEQLNDLLKKRKPVHAEFRALHKNGSYVWVESLVGLVQQRQGKQLNIVSLLRNIQQRKQAEETLHKNTEELRLITDNMSDVVSRITLDGVVVYVSPSCEAIFGYTPDELIGTMGFELVHPDDLSGTATRFQHAISTRTIESDEIRYRHKDGHYLWVENTAGAIYDQDGQITSLIVTTRDISRRKQAEEKLHQSQHLLEQITQTVPLDIYIYDVHLNKDIYHNRDTTLGYSLEELDQAPDTFYANLIHPDHRAKHAEKSQRLMNARDGEQIESEDRMLHASGEYRWYAFRDTVFARDANGKPSQFLGSMQDITDRKLAEEKLRRSEEQLRLITDNLRDVITHINPEGIITYTSPSSLAIFGYTPDEIVGKMGMERVHPDDLTMIVTKLQQAIETQSSAVIEYRYQHKAGHYVWVESAGGAVCDPDGQFLSMVTTTRDITRRKENEEKIRKNEEQLRRSEEQLRLITDHMGDVVSHITPDGKVAYVSPSSFSIFGFHPDEIIGQMGFENVHPDDLAETAAKFQSAIQAHTSEVIEYRYRHKDGHYIWVESAGGAVFDPEGQITSIVATSRNITQRKQAEEQLRKSEERFRLLANNSRDVIAQMGADGIIQYITPSSYSVLGLTPEDMIGHAPFDLVHPEDRNLVNDKFQGVIAGKIPYLMEFRTRHANGHYIWLELNTSVIHSALGVVDHLILSMRDVSVRKKTEEALRASEEQYRLLANNSTDMIGLHDLDGTCIYASPSIETQTGWTMQDVIGKTAQVNIHPDDLNRVIQELSEGFRDSDEVTLEYRFQCKDGTHIWVETHNRMTYLADGTPHRVVATTRNITARKEATMALKENEERLRLITDNMSDVIVQTSARGIVSYVSPSSRDVLGYEPQELIGQPTLVRIHPDDQAFAADKFSAAFLAHKPETMEIRYQHKNGSYIWIEMSGIVLVDEAGLFQGLVASIRNVEARKQADSALRASEQRLRLITDNIHDLVTLADTNLNFSYTSPSYYNVLGYTHEELAGKSVFELIHPDDLENVFQKARSAVERRGPETIEFRFQHKDGYYVWLEVTGRVIEIGGEITGAVITGRDISERRWMQRAHSEHERLMGALLKQQEMNVLKNRMMSRLSHELRTPLAVISTSSDLLEHYAHRMTDEQRRERLHQIRLQIKHFVGLLDNMSLVVKGSNYSGEFAPTPYDLEKLCNTVVEEVKDTLHAKHPVMVQLDGEIANVNSDEKLMRLILTHVLSNAIKFSPDESSISLHIIVNDETILLTIADEGIGIPADDVGQIFEPFFRATNVEEAPGLGIGLSIVQDAVNSVQGGIVVDSEVGRGTKVTVEIPLSTEVLRAALEAGGQGIRQ